MNNRNQAYQKSENDCARLYGKRVRLSGAGVDKLDVDGQGSYDRFKFDNKYTEKASYSINIKEWEKLIRQAKLSGKEFIGRIDFANGLKLICMEERTFLNNFDDKEDA